MSSRSDGRSQPEKTGRRLPRRLFARFHHLTISMKITIVYTVILLVILLLTSVCLGAGVYFAYYHQARKEVDFSEQQVLQQISEGRRFDDSFFQNDPIVPGVVLRVTDITGSVIFENDARYPSLSDIEANEMPLHRPFWATDNSKIANFHDSSIYHRSVDVMYNGNIYTLHFLRTITAEKMFLKKLLWFLLSTVLLGFIVALVAGYFLSRHALKPIRDITATARRIETTNMDQRIAVPPTHDEVEELAHTFNHMLDRLQAGFSQQQRFVSDASHELRTPVTVILGYSDLLSRWGQKDAKVLEEGIQSIRSEAEDMQQLIEKLLFLARADQKRQVLHKDYLELSELVEDVVKKMKLVTREHSIELLRNDKGTIYADPVTIRQMMRIFLENSRKYTPKGGHLTVSSEREPDGRHIMLTLADDGIGIAPEDQEKVWGRFYRVDQSRTKAKGVSGTGLGLSIAKWICDQHDIGISMESALGKGTAIHLHIPLAEDEVQG